MKKLLLIAISAISFTLKAQTSNDIKSLMTRRALTCQDIAYNNYYLIPELYNNKSLDTIDALLKYNKENCGYSNNFLDFEILYNISKGTFSDTTYVYRNLSYSLRAYKFYFEHFNDSRSQYFNYGFIIEKKVTDDYFLFIKKMAEDLSHKENLKDLESLLVAFYANPSNDILQQLESDKLTKTALGKEIQAYKNLYNPKIGMHYSIFSGIWMPTGNLKLLGNHPKIGIQIGGRGKNLMVNLTLEVRFLNSANYFYMQKDDSLYYSNHHTSFYVGLDESYAILQKKRHEIDILAGLGIDGIDGIYVNREDEDKKNITKMISSGNLNVGLGYKYFITQSTYAGMDFKFNKLFFNNKEGTDFSGNAFSINLTIGFSGGGSSGYYGHRYGYGGLR